MTRKAKHAYRWATVANFIGMMALSSCVHSEEPLRAPQVWNKEALADWGLPRADVKIHENYITEKDYYGSRAFNALTYPVYHPEVGPFYLRFHGNNLTFGALFSYMNLHPCPLCIYINACPVFDALNAVPCPFKIL